ncbi:acyl-CoA carboxylase epsilon subunit [Streptomyces sp. NPDC057474]|uniref:acyl-CoA carboxylase epsilon subunit n=1 Tax=Streptomyces sp. NPDC057474 TaxID=3346144 RepID=UPI003676BB2C
MSGVQACRAVLRVERGEASEEELAAVAVTLLSVLAGRGARRRAAAFGVRRAGWERAVPFRAPHSWR